MPSNTFDQVYGHQVQNKLPMTRTYVKKTDSNLSPTFEIKQLFNPENTNGKGNSLSTRNKNT